MGASIAIEKNVIPIATSPESQVAPMSVLGLGSPNMASYEIPYNMTRTKSTKVTIIGIRITSFRDFLVESSFIDSIV